MAGDYYELLGVSRSATKNEIKSADRQMAREYHPDVNQEPGAEEKFKEISRAYEVLSDPDTKSRYDRFGEAGVSGAGAGAGGVGFDPNDMGGIADIFETFFGGGFGGGASRGGSRRRGPTRGDDLRLDIHLKFREAVV